MALTRYRSLILTDPLGGPSAYYRLNDRYGTLARDEQVNAYAGTCSLTGITKGVTGAIANSPDAAMQFDGTAGTITLPSGLNPAGWGQITLEAWVNPSSATYGTATVIANANSAVDNKGVNLYVKTNGAGAEFDLGNLGGVSTATTITHGVWTHLAATYDGAHAKIYLNGVQQASAAITGTIVSAPQSFAIGSTPTGVGLYFTGDIDELVAWSYALTSAQLLSHYNAAANNQSGPYTVWLNAAPVESIASTLQVDMAVGRRSTGQVKVRTTTATHFYDDQQVYITDQNEALLFTGYLSMPREQKPGFQYSLIHTLQMVDQHRLADKRVVAAQYTGKSATYIITDIVNNILSHEGVTIAQLFDGPLPSSTLYPSTSLYPNGADSNPPAVLFGYSTVAQALDALTQQTTTAGISYYWQIDANKQLWFVPYSTLTNSTVIDGTKIDQVQQPSFVTRGNPAYGNTQYIVGGVAQTALQYKVIYGDGQTSSWVLDYNVYSISSITVNGVAQLVGVRGIDTGKDFYYQVGDPTINQDASETHLASGAVLAIWYTGEYPAIMTDTNAAQVAYEAALDGTSGIVETVTRDSTVTSFTQGLTLASQRNTRYAAQGTQYQFTTQQTGFVQGQFVTVNVLPHGLASQSMLIEQVTAHDRLDGFNIWYTINAIVGPYDVIWPYFFGKVLAPAIGPQSQSINVGSLSSLGVLASFTASITEATTLTVTVNGVAGVPITLTKTNAGLDMLRNAAQSTQLAKITYVAIGSGTTAPAATQTSLVSETFRKAVTSYTNGASHGEILVDFYLSPSDAVNFNIQEIGLFGDDANATPNSGTMIGRALYAHNPKLNTETIQLHFDVTYT